MQVKDVMTPDPTCCSAQDPLQKAAQLMVECDCGEIPVVDDTSSKMPVGVVTDRDMVCRSIAKGLNPLEMQVGDVMSTPLISVSSDDSLEDCCYLMEQNQIRRIPVIGSDGSIVGIVSLADLAEKASRSDSGEVLHKVSQATASASNVA